MIGENLKLYTRYSSLCGTFEKAIYKYAIQITAADTRDGFCSSSTLKACAWEKVDITKEQMVFADK